MLLWPPHHAEVIHTAAPRRGETLPSPRPKWQAPFHLCIFTEASRWRVPRIASEGLKSPSRPVRISGVFQTIISILFYFIFLFLWGVNHLNFCGLTFGWTWVAQNCTNAVRRVTSAGDGLQNSANKGLSETGKDHQAWILALSRSRKTSSDIHNNWLADLVIIPLVLFH